MSGTSFAAYKRMKYSGGVSLYCGLALLMTSCGGGSEDTAPIDLNQNSNSKTVRSIYARGGWQCVGFPVKGGEKIRIYSSGSWNGGQRTVDTDGKLTKALMVDASGGNGKVYQGGGTIGVIIDQSPFNYDAGLMGTLDGGVYKFCDKTLEAVVAIAAGKTGCNANGTYVAATVQPGLLVTIPTGNVGPICSSMERVITYLYGKPNVVIAPNSCLALDRTRLIGKIVPPGVNEKTVPPFDVGKFYETNPYTIPAYVPENSDICFRANDLDHGLGDNDGKLSVTVEKTN